VNDTPGDPAASYQVVERYGTGRFQISGQSFESSVLVFPERVQTWPIMTFAELDEAAFAPVLEAADEIELLLIGCGPRMELVSQAMRAPLRAAGIVIEPMDTGAAARTFNLLLSEDRRVAAGLIALP